MQYLKNYYFFAHRENNQLLNQKSFPKTGFISLLKDLSIGLNLLSDFDLGKFQALKIQEFGYLEHRSPRVIKTYNGFGEFLYQKTLLIVFQKENLYFKRIKKN